VLTNPGLDISWPSHPLIYSSSVVVSYVKTFFPSHCPFLIRSSFSCIYSQHTTDSYFIDLHTPPSAQPTHLHNMIGQQASPCMEPQSPLDGSMRKRVCKACDRCRLKKSKCDGSSVCSRCRADNAICVFGERKKTHDKVYPKG
jgi:Fungal Zn(2)-Cys(6) binuclear cluster domain